MACTALLAAAPAHAVSDALYDQTWCTYASPHFELITDLDEDKARSLLETMETFDHVVRAVPEIEHPPQGRRLKSIAFSDRDDFERVFRLPLTAGFLNSVLPETLLVLSADRMGNVLADNARHEYAHYVLRHSPPVPLWYEEGYASFLSTVQVQDGVAKFGGRTKHWGKGVGERMSLRIHSARRMSFDIRDHYRLPIEQVLSASNVLEWPPQALQDFYRTSWLLVHRLNIGHHGGFPNQLPAVNPLLERLSAGEDARTAFERTVGMSVKAADRELRRYAVRSLPTIERPVPEQPPLELSQSRCLTADEAVEELAFASVTLNHPFSLSAFQWLVARREDNVMALNGLSRVLRYQGEHIEAIAMAERALSLAPDHAPSMISMASALTARCSNALACREDWMRAERLYLRALSREPNDVEAALGIGMIRLMLGAPAMAIQYLERAHQQAPWIARISFFLGEAHRQRGQTEVAVHYLRAALNWEKDERWRQPARRALAAIGIAPGSPASALRVGESATPTPR